MSRAGAGPGAPPEILSVPARGFDWGDTIVGTTDPEKPNEVTDLPPDPRNPAGKRGDFFELSRRLRLLADRPIVLRVRRHDRSVADLLVPASYHLTLGLRMRTGPVAGVRDDSPAQQAGVEKGDILTAVVLKSGSETKRFVQLIREVTQGKTLLTVEHDMGVVFGLADKIAVLVYGEVIAFDVPERVRGNARVQEAYLGSFGEKAA